MENQVSRIDHKTKRGNEVLAPVIPAHAGQLTVAIQYLCSMKRTLALTPHQAQTWLAVLGVFDVTLVNRAIIKIGISADPFPDLGKIVEECEAMRREAIKFADNRLPTPAPLIKRVAAALRLPID